MKIKNLKLKIILTSVYLLSFASPAYAQCVNPNKGVDIKECFGFGEIKSFGQSISLLVTPGFSIASVLVIIYFLFGAFKFLTSGGDKEAIASGRQMIIHAIIGFMILMFVFVIMQFLLFNLLGITDFQIF